MSRDNRHVFVFNKTKQTFLAFRVKVADSILGRMVGLLGKRSLKPDSGVWIVPANSVHSIGMLFRFDLILIDKDFRVVGLRELVRPFSITRPNFKAESVIELPAHTIFRSRTAIGDELVIDRYEPAKSPAGEAKPMISSVIPPAPPPAERHEPRTAADASVVELEPPQPTLTGRGSLT